MRPFNTRTIVQENDLQNDITLRKKTINSFGDSLVSDLTSVSIKDVIFTYFLHLSFGISSVKKVLFKWHRTGKDFDTILVQLVKVSGTILQPVFQFDSERPKFVVDFKAIEMLLISQQ